MQACIVNVDRSFLFSHERNALVNVYQEADHELVVGLCQVLQLHVRVL